MTLSVRLDPATERMIARLARARGVTRSELVRSALLLLEDQSEPQGGPTMYDRISDLVGNADLPPALSVQSGKTFRKRLIGKNRR